ncbi:hypothetical protein EDC04DRAFT_2697733 [Pisolithus marmoratus]|nr:hypothetical protein EDC04DRAFT_2697733 [Pisolithus marmoratus]
MYSGANDAQDHAPPTSLLFGGNGCDVPFIQPAQAHARDGERGVQITSPSEGCTGAVNSVGFSPCQKGTVPDSQDNVMRISSTAVHIPDQMSGALSYVGQDTRVNCHDSPYLINNTGVGGSSSLAFPVPVPLHATYSPISGNHEMAQMNVSQRDEVTCGVTLRDHWNSTGHSLDRDFDPSLLLSFPANVLPPSSHSLDAYMSSTGVLNAHPLSSLDRNTSQPGCVDNHEKMSSSYGASGRKVKSAIPLSPPSNTAWLQAQVLNPSTSNYYCNGGSLSVPMWSPVTDCPPVVTPDSLPTTRPILGRIAHETCGWKGDDGQVCGNPVTSDSLANHFAVMHGIKNMASDIKVECRWCPPSSQKRVKRESMLRHLREVHLKCSRPKKGDAKFSSQFPSIGFRSSDTFGADVTVREQTCLLGLAYIILMCCVHTIVIPLLPQIMTVRQE